MKKQIVNTFVSLVTVVIFMVGCGGSSSATPTASSTQAEVSNPIPTANIESGEVSTDTVIPVKAKDGKTELATVTLVAGTKFTNSTTNETITETPKLVVKAEKSTEARTEVSFILDDGTKVIPTEPVKISIPAPAGAKAGDKVEIDVADGITADTSKLTLFMVGNDGRISLFIAPRVFRGANVYVVIFVVRLQAITGVQ